MSIVARYSTVQLQVRAARSIYCAALTEKNKWRAGTTRRRSIFQTDLDLDLSQDESVTARHAGIQRGQYRAGLSPARLLPRTAGYSRYNLSCHLAIVSYNCTVLFVPFVQVQAALPPRCSTYAKPSRRKNAGPRSCDPCLPPDQGMMMMDRLQVSSSHSFPRVTVHVKINAPQLAVVAGS